jgi:hypothetical protein
MATSGTSQFSLPFDELIEQASLLVGGEATLGTEARTLRRALNLLFIDMQNRGILLHSLEQGLTSLVSGVTSINCASSTIDLVDMVARVYSGTNYTDFPMQRKSFDEWLEIPIKTQTGPRPYWYWVDRKTDGPVIHIWPTPVSPAATIVYWRVRFLQSASKLADDPDFPRRFFPALVSGLAYNFALQRGMAFPMDRLNMLKANYEEQLMHAFGEDRERVNLRIVPKVYRNR